MKRLIAFILLLSLISASCLSLSESNSDNQLRELRYGDTGDDVKALQMRLTELGYYKGKLSGNFLEGTRKAVEKFQKDYGLEKTGVADLQTLSLLYSDTMESLSASQELSPSPEPEPKERVSEGITFQGVPWYSTPEEALQILIDSGFVDAQIMSTKSWTSKLKSLYDISNASGKSEFYYDQNSEVGYSIFCSRIGSSKKGKVPDQPVSTKLKTFSIDGNYILKTIAKLSISEIDLRFSVDSGIPQLVEIDIHFSSGGSKSKAALDDALQTAYGKPVISKKSQAGFGSYSWLGSNSTIVIHYFYYVSFSMMDGLILSDTVNVQVKETPALKPEPEREDTGF